MQLLESKGDPDPWIAARFDQVLPTDFRVGDNTYSESEDIINYPLVGGHEYRIFVRAFAGNSVRTLKRICS